jgi:hypothetical protein
MATLLDPNDYMYITAKPGTSAAVDKDTAPSNLNVGSISKHQAGALKNQV